MAANTKAMRLGTCVTIPARFATSRCTLPVLFYATLNVFSAAYNAAGIAAERARRRVLAKKPTTASRISKNSCDV